MPPYSGTGAGSGFFRKELQRSHQTRLFLLPIRCGCRVYIPGKRSSMLLFFDGPYKCWSLTFIHTKNHFMDFLSEKSGSPPTPPSRTEGGAVDNPLPLICLFKALNQKKTERPPVVTIPGRRPWHRRSCCIPSCPCSRPPPTPPPLCGPWPVWRRPSRASEVCAPSP